VIPTNDQTFQESPSWIYEKVHLALREALVARGHDPVVAAIADRGASVNDSGYSECFANPVRADVMLQGRKIAGAAQRRTRRGLLQQGSIQGFNMGDDFPEGFANALANTLIKKEIAPFVLDRAQAIAAEKYATKAWLRKR
jgi:lipoyl(octanoyl) transferase